MVRTYTGGGEERASASRKLEGSGKTLVHNSIGDDIGRNLTLVERCTRVREIRDLETR